MTKYLYLRFKDPATFRNRHYKNYRRAWVLFHCVSLSCRVPSWSCCACVCVFFYRLLHWLLDPVSPAINQLITSPSVLTCLSSVNYFHSVSAPARHTSGVWFVTPVATGFIRCFVLLSWITLTSLPCAQDQPLIACRPAHCPHPCGTWPAHVVPPCSASSPSCPLPSIKYEHFWINHFKFVSSCALNFTV